jgi:hypothetical protein
MSDSSFLIESQWLAHTGPRGASGGACDGDDEKEGDHLTPGLSGRSFDGNQNHSTGRGAWMVEEGLSRFWVLKT